MKQPPSPGRESLARREIVKQMQKEHLSELGLSNKTVTEVLNAFVAVYKDAILNNKRVEVRNFGVMNSELVRGRLINHPETKEQTIASPYYRLAFKPSAIFKEKLKARAKQEASET